MCYVSTPYYLLCGCYGKQQPVGEPCGRESSSQPNNWSGCYDPTDLGVENVEGVCPRCAAGKTFGMTNSSSRKPMFPASPPDGRSTSECARLLLKCLPDSVKSKQVVEKDGESVDEDSESKKEDSESEEKDSKSEKTNGKSKEKDSENDADASETSSTGTTTSSDTVRAWSRQSRNMHWRAYDDARH